MGVQVFNDPEMQEIFEGFLVESRELLDAVSQDLMRLENEPEDLDLLNQIFRSFHTIKGTSGFMGFDDIVGITHHAEDILNKLRKAEIKVSQPIIDVLLEVHDWIERLIERIQTGDDEPFDYSDTVEQIIILKSGTQSSEPELIANPAQSKIESISNDETAEDDTNILEKVLSDKDLITKPGDFTDDELDLIQAAFAEMNKGFAVENSDKITDIESVFQSDEIKVNVNVEPLPEESSPKQTSPAVSKEIAQNKQVSASKQAPKSQSSGTETIRIDVNRVEALMNLSGELVLGRNRLAQITEQLLSVFENKDMVRDLIETTDQIDNITSDIQAAVMKMRMVPIGKLYQKAPRIVRDLAREFNKKIQLIVKGEETEIDRGIIEELNDPLVHMIRNSCDHGIESTQDRIKAGKSDIGTVTLDAEQEGNNIVLRISDDGKGMDPEKLKAKAIEKGIITHEQAAQMSNREAFQMIFMPGFSTATVVSNVSGRGVGMDVVRTNIQNLKGLIEIESEIGMGTTFVIKLPLTLAIIQGLLVKVQQETYAIPLSSVVEVVAVDMNNIYSVNTQEVVRLRNEVYPIIRLDKVLGLETPLDRLEERYIVVVGLGLQRVGFVVEELLGQQEIVIKSLGDYLGNLSAIAGSTILGDGRVIMIIDVADLINLNLNIAGSVYSGV